MPQITEKAQEQKREGRVDLNLYKDALRRRTHPHTAPNNEEDIKKKEPGREDVHVLRRFERMFNACFEAVDKNEIGMLNYSETSLFFQQFGCIPAMAEGEECKAMREFWVVLKADQRGGISKGNLCLALKGILRVPFVPSESTNSHKPSENEGTGLTFSEEGALQLNEKEGLDLHKRFYEFFLKSRYAANLTKGPLQDTGSDDCTFKPEINAKTEALAPVGRHKFAGNYDGRCVGGDLPLPERLLHLQKDIDEYLHLTSG